MIYIEESLFQIYYAELKRYPYFETKGKVRKKRITYHTDETCKAFIKKHGIHKMLGGDFLSGVAKICQFVHKLVPAGSPQIENPCRFHGIELLEHCLQGYGLNCTGYSIVLNDILLSLGIKSKCLWCLSYAHPFDEECHALNHVFDCRTHSWIVADSAMGCVPTIEGKGIDISALREALIAGKKVDLLKNVTCCDEAFTDMYRRYMTKNTFMFLVLGRSGLYYDTKDDGILVIPKGFARNKAEDYGYPYFITNHISYLTE